MPRHLFAAGSVLSLLLGAAMLMLWLASFVLTKPIGHPGAGFKWIRLDEGDDYVIVRDGRIEEWINTPWDGKWYAEASLPLWVPALVFFGLAIGGRMIPKVLPRVLPVSRHGGQDSISWRRHFSRFC